MNMATQLDGERIVKEVTDEVQARAVLAQRYRPLKHWHYTVTFVGGALWGVFVATQTGSIGSVLVGAAAGVGLFAGAASYRHCVQLRRRLDAALVLLQAPRR